MQQLIWESAENDYENHYVKQQMNPDTQGFKSYLKRRDCTLTNIKKYHGPSLIIIYSVIPMPGVPHMQEFQVTTELHDCKIQLLLFKDSIPTNLFTC